MHALSAPGWWRNKCSYSSIWHSHWTRVNGLSTFFFIAVVVMYWEARMRIHQQKHTWAEPCFFLRVIYNKQFCRCVVRFQLNRGPNRVWRTVRFDFFLRTVPPLIYIAKILKHLQFFFFFMKSVYIKICALLHRKHVTVTLQTGISIFFFTDDPLRMYLAYYSYWVN